MSNLFFFRPLFMLELILAEAMFLSKLNIRTNFFIRLIISLLFCFGISFILPTNFENIYYYSFLFLIMFLVTIIASMFCFKAPLKNILFCAIAGYTIQHIASECYEMFNNYMNLIIERSFNFYDAEGTIDINAQKGPNIAGRDLFLLYIYSNGMVDDLKTSCNDEDDKNCTSWDGNNTTLTKDEREDMFNKACSSSGEGFHGCFGKILNDNWQMTY